MGDKRFDNLARTLLTAASRRDLLAGLTSGLLAAVPFRLGKEDVAAKKKRKKKKKKIQNQSPPPPAPTCSDGIKNGSETDVDCGGGTCPRCSNNQSCAGGNDCASGLCVNQLCRACDDSNDCGAGCFCAQGPGGVCASSNVVNLGLGSTCNQCPGDNLLYCSQEGLIAYCVYRCGT